MHSQLSSLLMVIIQVSIGLSAPPQRNNQRSNNPPVCLTENCKEVSAYILNGLNPEKDPCDDFYEFTCGRWQRTNPLPQEQDHWSRFSVLYKQVGMRLINILEAPNEANVPRSVALMRKYYRDCMDVVTLDRIGIGPIDRILRHLGDWPLLTSNAQASISWQELDRRYSELKGTYSFIHIKGDTNVPPSPTYEIRIDSAGFPNSYDFPADNRWRDGQLDIPYVKYAYEVAKTFYRYRNINYPEKKLIKDVAEMLNFEYLIHEAIKNAEYRVETIRGLQIAYNAALPPNHNGTANINWYKSIADLLKLVNIQINENQIVYINVWKYIMELGKLLDATPNRIIVNYIHWKFIADTMSFTTDHMRRLTWDTYGKGHAQNRPSRQIECLNDCPFRPALFYEYAKRYFTPRAKENSLQMAKRVQKKALDEVGRVNWLDEATKFTLLRKIQGMYMMIGYPDYYSDQYFTDFYQILEPRASYAEEMINALKFSHLVNLSKFRRPVDKYEWASEPIDASGIYHYYYNKITFPMAMIQAHDCCNDVPRAVQYGFDGFIIGHEIFHGLDPIGMEYGENGRFLSLPSRTGRSYNDKVKCLVNEYNGYTLMDIDPRTGVSVSVRTYGELSKKEDVADTGGIRVAFEAYQEANRNDLKLPGLGNYSSDQLFFISYASEWCTTGTRAWWKKTFESNYYDGGHSPVRLRVNNPLKNYHEFAKAFNCKPRSNMIWTSKCTIFN